MRHQLIAFWIPFLIAVGSATLAISFFWTIPMSELEYLWFALQITPVTALFVAVLSLGPCMLAVHLTERRSRLPDPLTYMIWGFWTGLIIVAAHSIASSGSDFSCYRDYIYWLPASAFSGAIGGWVFGLLRKRILQDNGK